MAGFKRIRTRELTDIEKELVMAFRVTKWKNEKLIRNSHDMNCFWWAFGQEFNDGLARMIERKKEIIESKDQISRVTAAFLFATFSQESQGLL